MKIKKSQLKQLLLEEVGGFIFDKEGKITPANLQDALEALFQRLKDEDKAEDSKNEATEKKLTYNNFVQMVRDDMMAGASPDEKPSEEQVKKKAKAYYNDYLQGASVDDLFEATEEDLENKEKEVELQKALNTELEKTNDLVKETTEEEAWNHFYSKGINQGMSEDDAANYADEKAEEYLTTLAELTSGKKK